MSDKLYKYFSIFRPFEMGTFPKDYVDIKNYETRQQVLPGIMAYGEVTYNRKLTEEELKYYELKEDVDKEEALQDIRNLDKIDEVLLNKKFYDKEIKSVIGKISDIIQKEKEKKAYRSDISREEYKKVTKDRKHIVEMDKNEAIRYYADKIIYDCIVDCMADTEEGTNVFYIEQYENNQFIIENLDKIVERINKDERVSYVEADMKKKQIDLVFYLDYCPHYYPDDLDLTNEERISHLNKFIEFLNLKNECILPNRFKSNTRRLINEYIESMYDEEDKDYIYYETNKELDECGFIDKYIEDYTVRINAENLPELIMDLQKLKNEIETKLEEKEVHDE